MIRLTWADAGATRLPAANRPAIASAAAPNKRLQRAGLRIEQWLVKGLGIIVDDSKEAG
jgi:hypothetical protein